MSKLERVEYDEIPGLSIIENFITKEEEKELLNCIDKESWSNALKRRTQHYGYKYDYTTRSLPQKLDDLSKPWMKPVLTKLVETKIFPVCPEQIIVNEYTPGQGISKHIDQPKIFGPIVASLSLESPCIMTLESPQKVEYDLFLKPRSLLILTGKSRYNWFHSIPSRKSDTVEGKIIPRERRVSLTFRTVVK